MATKRKAQVNEDNTVEVEWTETTLDVGPKVEILGVPPLHLTQVASRFIVASPRITQ